MGGQLQLLAIGSVMIEFTNIFHAFPSAVSGVCFAWMKLLGRSLSLLLIPLPAAFMIVYPSPLCRASKRLLVLLSPLHFYF